jgi:2-dehydro-3-deoxy-D-gluconate 5-dehydrogenase
MILDKFKLDGKVALVTGASSGIGQAIACGLADAGAAVACHARRTGGCAETQAQVAQLRGTSFEVTGDLSESQTASGLIDQTKRHFGRVDILVNNAGMIRRAPAVDHTDDDWQTVIDVNLSSVFRLCREAGRLMIAQGGGKVINIASLLSFQGGITVPAYTASKSAVAGLTKALANEWAGSGVNVNAIAPGYIATKNTAALQSNETRNRQILERIPAGRWGDPSDLVGAAVFLSSPASDYVSGHVLVVDGGWMGR